MWKWQPIETAPKDGKPFMVWADGYEWPEVIRWFDYDAEEAEEAGEPGYFTYAEEAMQDFDWEHDAVQFWAPIEPPHTVQHPAMLAAALGDGE